MDRGAGGVTVRAPAKVNLELRVGAPRADGYHELATVYHAIGMFDELVATPIEHGIELTVEGPQAEDVPLDGTNLAAMAAALVLDRTGIDAGVRLHLRKGIPVAGGMAGGSADAAAALLACDLVWRAGLTREELAGLAAELGSDVPFSLLGGTAVGTGRGEQLTPALARGEYHWVVAVTDHGLSTPKVYAEIDRLRSGRQIPEPRVSDELMHALRAGDAEALGAALGNDLEPAACSLDPGLERTLEVGRDAGALGSLVSGSGPTTIFLARGPEHALDVAVALTASGTATAVRRAQGPVGGARVVEPVRA